MYAKIANCCCVRLDCGTYKMRFGEVGVKKLADWFLDDQVVAVYGKYYYDFPTVIWPESCRAVTLGDDTFYLAVLDNRRADGAWKKGVFLCTWNKHGEPLAVRELDDCQTLKTLAADADGRVSISYGTSGGKTAVRTFRLAESNAVTIRSAEMR